MRIASHTVSERATLGTVLIASVVSVNELLAAILGRVPHGAVLARVGPETNTGSVLGFAQGGRFWLPIALAGLCASVLVIRVAAPSMLGTGLLAGGAAANTLQRVTLHGVSDYIQLGTAHAGLALNVADIALLVGAILTTRSVFNQRDHSTAGKEVT